MINLYEIYEDKIAEITEDVEDYLRRAVEDAADKGIDMRSIPINPTEQELPYEAVKNYLDRNGYSYTEKLGNNTAVGFGRSEDYILLDLSKGSVK